MQQHRRTLPKRRHNCAGAPPSDLHRRGWGGMVSEAPPERRPWENPLPAQNRGSSSLRRHLVKPAGAKERIEFLLTDVLETLQSRPHRDQVKLAAMFRELQEVPSERQMLEVISALQLPCLMDREDVRDFIRHCLGPMPLNRERVLQTLRGGSTEEREQAVDEAFNRLSRGSSYLNGAAVRDGFMATAHPSFFGANKHSVASILGDFLELQRAEEVGVIDGDYDLPVDRRAFQRLCEALCMSCVDKSFCHLLKVCFPGGEGTLGSGLQKIRRGLQQSNAKTLNRIYAGFRAASSKGAPEDLACPPLKEPFRYSGGVLVNQPSSSNPVFAGYHKKFFKGYPYVHKDLIEAVVPAPIKKERCFLRMSEFTEWLKTWKLPEVTITEIHSLFVLTDIDRGETLDFDELNALLMTLSAATTKERREIAVAIAKNLNVDEDAHDEVIAHVNFVGLTDDDASFSEWVTSQFPGHPRPSFSPATGNAIEALPTALTPRAVRFALDTKASALSAEKPAVAAARWSREDRERFQRGDELTKPVAPFRYSIFGS
eukprot:gnl/MRDRNA2_/MRDRNA2_114400_c0_seq1.p1 gnl/MRDRNA2_/MRDRNA2_114400_c0~~gnl/MRDRNA2_/MRDRNA2_114400_c0_seq1.p1  ORF type:complete len:543 (-),score=105.11 gnl/MRDRNA2_/MRDRNA2_114400_c0_seq1:20-1648(-)